MMPLKWIEPRDSGGVISERDANIAKMACIPLHDALSERPRY